MEKPLSRGPVAGSAPTASQSGGSRPRAPENDGAAGPHFDGLASPPERLSDTAADDASPSETLAPQAAIGAAAAPGVSTSSPATAPGAPQIAGNVAPRPEAAIATASAAAGIQLELGSAARAKPKPLPPPAPPTTDGKLSWRDRLRRLTVKQALESWTGSLLLHGMLLVLLAMVSLTIPKASTPQRLIEVLERPQELLNERLESDLTPSSQVSLAASGGTVGAMTHGEPLSAPTEPALDQVTSDSLDGPTVRLADVSLNTFTDERLINDLGMESPGDPSAVVDGYKPAMDRITQELLVMLAKGPVLVTWLFDQSESMKNDQQEIRDNIEEIYAEMKLTSADDGDQLLTAVASFGAEVAMHTRRPTNDLDAVRNAIDEVPVDQSGVESMCQAVVEVVRQQRKFAVQGRRQLALILVTDESGDDTERIEEAIDAAREANCRVYVLGREAVFGYPYVHVVWTDETTGYTYWIPIRRGPETPFPELLQTDGLWRRRDAFPSGFGPFEQVRLARRTGGVFYLLPSLESNVLNGEQRVYALEAMRPYLPDLDSRADYDAELRASPLRTALREVIEILNPWTQPEVNLAEYYPLEGTEFAKLAVREQEKCQAYVRFLQAAEERLDGLRGERREEPLPRWQANYDLMLAQVVSYQVRAYEYAAVIDRFLRNPQRPKEPRTNHWRVNPIPDGITASETQAAMDRSKRLLGTVIELHPGTPYAGRAEWELARGFGCQLVEHFHPPDYDDVKRPNF